MYINISDFISNDSEQILEESGRINLGQIEDGLKLSDGTEYSLFISKVDKELFLDIKVYFEYEKACDRCLCPTLFEDEIKYSAKIINEDFINREEENYGEDYVVMTDNEIDLGDLIRQLVILAIPLKSLCNDNCQGICPICGQDLNEGKCNCQVETEDPRFSVLKNLVINEEV